MNVLYLVTKYFVFPFVDGHLTNATKIHAFSGTDGEVVGGSKTVYF